MIMFAKDTEISDFVQSICKQYNCPSNELIIGMHDNAEAYLEHRGVDPAYHRWIIQARSKDDAEIAVKYLYENADYQIDRSSLIQSEQPWVFIVPVSKFAAEHSPTLDTV